MRGDGGLAVTAARIAVARGSQLDLAAGHGATSTSLTLATNSLRRDLDQHWPAAARPHGYAAINTSELTHQARLERDLDQHQARCIGDRGALAEASELVSQRRFQSRARFASVSIRFYTIILPGRTI